MCKTHRLPHPLRPWTPITLRLGGGGDTRRSGAERARKRRSEGRKRHTKSGKRRRGSTIWVTHTLWKRKINNLGFNQNLWWPKWWKSYPMLAMIWNRVHLNCYSHSVWIPLLVSFRWPHSCSSIAPSLFCSSFTPMSITFIVGKCFVRKK